MFTRVHSNSNKLGGKRTFSASANVSFGKAKPPFTKQNDRLYRLIKHQVSNFAQKLDIAWLLQWLNTVMETNVGN